MKDAEKRCFSLIFNTDSKVHNFLSSFFFLNQAVEEEQYILLRQRALQDFNYELSML